MSELVHVHASGCARATEDEWWDALDCWSEGVDVITLTEAGGRAFLLGGWAELNGFRSVTASTRGKSECAVLVRKDYGTIEKVRYRLLTPLRLRTARKAPLYAVKVLVVSHFGHRTWVTAAHMPAHVERKGRLSLDWAGKVYRAAALGWSGMLWRGWDDHIVSADWNLNHRRRWVRAYLRTLFPDTRSGWDFKDLPERGTLRGSLRLIDGPRSNLPIVQHSKVLPSMPGFDHLAVRTVYRTRGVK